MSRAALSLCLLLAAACDAPPDLGSSTPAVVNGSASTVDAVQVVSSPSANCFAVFVDARHAITLSECVDSRSGIGTGSSRVGIEARFDSDIVHMMSGMRLTVVRTVEDVSVTPLALSGTPVAMDDPVTIVGITTEGAATVTNPNVDPGRFTVAVADPLQIEQGDGVVLDAAGDLAGIIIFSFSDGSDGWAVDMSTMRDFVSTSIAAPTPLPDAGIEDAGVGDAGPAGGSDAGPGMDTDGGCSVGGGASPLAGWALLAVALCFWRRRR